MPEVVQFKYSEIENLFNAGWLQRPDIPSCILNNINSRFEMRDYQREALQNFIAYYEQGKLNNNKSIWTLFHMATGSGKTYIMACLILYLYEKGYRDFIFFVNQDNIVEKTKENFLNKNFQKYLFEQDVNVNGEIVEIRQVESFRYSKKDAINIMFTTIQGLHLALNNVKEGTITLNDFTNKKIVLIADEAHHINADTKKLKGKEKKEEEESLKSWEQTVNKIYFSNRDNVLLEFTATCDLKNPNISEKYSGNPAEIIYDYPLLKFRASGYTKDLMNMRTTLNPIERTIQAMLLSQYRLKLFEKYKIASSKPVILLKSADTTDNCDKFYDDFVRFMKTGLNARVIDTIRNQGQNNENSIVNKMFEYFESQHISDDDLIAELRLSFSVDHLAKIHSEVKNKEELQILLNDLENPRNPIRMVFTVDMLNEGWDVLNLFDIVRLYDERKDRGDYISKTTISEAQLIGRGARYFPFKLKEEVLGSNNEVGKRKFDAVPEHELRICETLFYHCIDESRYIDEIKKALKETGFTFSEEPFKFEYKIKEEFKQTKLFKEGKLFVNTQKTNESDALNGIPQSFALNSEVSFVKKSSVGSLYEDTTIEKDKKIAIIRTYKVKEIENRFVYKAMRQYPVFRFNRLKLYFPNLNSLSEFISSDSYLGRYEFSVKSYDVPSQMEIYEGLIDLLGKLSTKILGIKESYYGTKEFKEVPLASFVVDSPREKMYSKDVIEEKEGEGISQNAGAVNSNYRLDLSDKEWFVYNDNYGTTEEKRFVKYFSSQVDKLKALYQIVYLIRNERKYHMYSFAEGKRFEPDYILILGNENVIVEQQQIFIEPKGEHLRKNDEWKELFLLELEKNAKCITYHDDGEYKILGLPFYTHGTHEQAFKNAFEKLIE